MAAMARRCRWRPASPDRGSPWAWSRGGRATCSRETCGCRARTGAARALLHARAHAIDLGVVQRSDGAHYFAVVAGTGFDAQLMAGTGSQEKRRWKFGAYIARAVLTLPSVRSAGH